MKRMLTMALMLMLIACMVSAGPTNKGTMTLGGTIGFQSASGDLYENGDGDGQTTFGIMPSFGYFIADNIVIGADLGFGNYSQGDYKEKLFYFGPMVGYFFGVPVEDAKGTVLPYIKAHFMFGSYKEEYSGGGEQKDKYTQFGARLGADYFLSSAVALDFGIDFNSNSYEADTDDPDSESESGTVFGFSAGISAFIF